MKTLTLKIATVTGVQEIKKNRDAEITSRIAQAELTEAEDVQSIELVSQCGDQYNPLPDSTLFVLDIGAEWKIAIASSDETEPDDTIDAGERKIYALNSSREVQACIRLKNDGTIVLNEGDDWAVQFTALKEAFDQLKSDLNAFVSKFNSHQHNYLPGPGSATPTVPTIPPTVADESTADMSDSKIDSIQVP